MKEYDDCARIELMYPDPQWSPHDNSFAEEEFVREDLEESILEHQRI
jgi:hypothetical protein